MKWVKEVFTILLSIFMHQAFILLLNFPDFVLYSEDSQKLAKKSGDSS